MRKPMRDSGIDWIGKIPQYWKTIKFKFTHQGGNVGESIDKDYYGADEEGKVYYTAGLTPVYTSSEFPEWKLTNEDDLLLSRNGNPYVYIPQKKAAYSDHIIRVTVSKDFDKRFLRYSLQRSIDNEVANAVSIATWSMSLWDEQHLAMPEQREQKKIADFLDQKCSRIDAVIDKTKDSIEEYKRLKQAVITQAVTKGIRGDRPMKDSGIDWIGEMPLNWRLIKIKWLLKERKDRSETGNEEPLSMSQKYGLIPTKDMDMIPNMAASFVGAKIVHEGDLVFNKLKAHLGVFSVSEYDGLVSPDYAVYYQNYDVNLKFLEYLFKTSQYISEFRKRSSGVGAGLTRLYTKDLYSIYCSLPSLEEQNEIVNYINCKTSEMNSIIDKKNHLITELETYKKSLIYEYVTGKKEVPSA